MTQPYEPGQGTPPIYPPPGPNGPPVPGTPPIYPAPAPYPQPPYPQPPYPQPPPRRRTGLWVALGVVAAVLVGLAMWAVIADNRSNSTGSTSTPTPTSGQNPAATGETKVVTASDQKCQLTVPTSWNDIPADAKNELASLQVGDLRKEQYALVIPEDSGDFEDFAAFTNGSLEAARNLVEGAEIGEQRKLTIGGLNAVQYQVTGKSGGIRAVFWYTMIEGKRGYYQVLGWTLPSKKAEAEPAILKVVDTFQEVAAG